MNSFKSPKSTDRVREWKRNIALQKVGTDGKSSYSMIEAVERARAKAEKEIFKQKVQAHLIMAGAMIVILIMSFYW